MTVPNMRWNVGLLSGCWGLVTTCNLILVTISALAGHHLAEDKALATLPAALMWFGTALATTPASFLMQRIGRRAGFMIAAAIGVVGALVAGLAVVWGSFALLCVGVGTIGGFNAFNYYYRFAAAETATDAFRSRAISLVLAGGVLSAIVGPELAKWSRNLIEGYEFVGSFGVIIAFATIAFLAISRLDMPRPTAVALRGGRALREIARQPTYLVAVSGGVIAYGVMALMMTITAVAMVGAHHPFEDAAFVIQWHVLGMFVPSFFTGHLIRRFGVLNVMICGAVLLLVCLGVGLCRLGGHTFLDRVDPARRRLELPVHRRDDVADRVLHPGRARQGPGGERIHDLRRRRGRDVPVGQSLSPLRLVCPQLARNRADPRGARRDIMARPPPADCPGCE